MIPLSKSTEKYYSVPDSEYFLRDHIEIKASREEKKRFKYLVVDFFCPVDYNQSKKDYPSVLTHNWALNFPENKQLDSINTLKLQLPLTDLVCERLKKGFHGRINFHDDETKILFDNVIVAGLRADRNAQIVANYKQNKTLPKNQLLDHSDKDRQLSCFQKVPVHNAYNSEGYGLFQQQGTGKTPEVINLICNEAIDLRRNNPKSMHYSIIVAPKNVRTNWESEFYKFAIVPGKCIILRGTEMNRRKQIYSIVRKDNQSYFATIITSYESLTKSWSAFYDVFGVCGINSDNPVFPLHLAVLDESHYIKNVQTKRYKTAMKLRDVATKRLALTGTAVTNSIADLYSQLEFLGYGYSGFSTFQAFKRFYEPYEDNVTNITAVQNLPFAHERLARYTYICTRAEVMPELPKKQYDQIEVQMSREQTEIYNQVKDEIFIEIQDELDHLDESNNREMEINSILTRMLKLSQITSGYISWPEIKDDDGKIIRSELVDRFDPNEKIEEVVRLLKEKDEVEKTLIWACWVQNIKSLRERLQREGIDCVTYYGATSESDRDEAIYRYNCDPKCRVFIANPAAGGTGLNLIGYPPEGSPIYKATGTTSKDWKTNTTHEIYFSQNWSGPARWQSEDRAVRRGTRVPVRITDLVVPGTIDPEIRDAVVDKKLTAYVVSDLRRIFNNIVTGDLIRD